MTAIVQEASKAATMTSGGELTCISFPITKVEETADGDLMVTGTASDGSVDSDEQIVDPEWAQKGPGGLQDWFDTAGNVRVQHQSQRDPAGKGVHIEFARDSSVVKSLVVEPVAKELVRKGILTAYSVGIANPQIVRDPLARGGRIKGGQIVELSLVDRPANKNCGIQLVKAAGDGSPEFTGKVFGDTGLLTKDAAPARNGKTVTVELPRNMSLSVKPSDLAKLATFKQKLVTKQAAAPSVTKAVVPETVKRDMDPNVGGGVDRDKIPDADFAGRNRSFPIVTAADVSDAFQSIGRAGEGNYSPAKLRRNIKRIAQRKGFPLPAADQKPAKAAKAAEPQTTKCMKCMGKGMVDGSPCTSCKRGAKKAKRMAAKAAAGARKAVRAALEPGATKKRGKMKALCPGCGAKQNHKHEFCTECGGQLPAMPPMVAKNHDFMCLGCGHDLDKGEKHCPGCGKENPGHNPMADMKIPANEAAKARKDRVAKKARKKGNGNKKEPFGGHQAMPFGSDGNDETSTKGSKPGKGKKPKTGHKPTPAEAGGVPGQHDKPAPPHREPDGGTVEAFERDAHLEDGDDEKATRLQEQSWKSADPEAAAAMALKALDVPQHLGALHALTCPAYHPEAVAKAFPHAAFAAIDLPEWHAGALEKAASAPLAEAQGAMAVYNAAVTLKAADVHMLADLRSAAHKAFRDANPGPGSFPEPGQISPQRFSRPYISDGHGAASPGHQGPHHAKLPDEGGIVAADHNRPYIEAGHAAESPSSSHTPGPMAPPATTGHPTGEPARGFMSSNGIASMQHAMSAMHDHISRRFPDVCPMEASLDIGSRPVPVPHGVPQPSRAPGARKARKAAKAAKATARKAAKVKAQKMAARRRKVERRVLKGAMSVADARVKLGMEPLDPSAPPESPMSKGAAAPLVAALDPEALKAALTEATAPLQAALVKSRKAQAKQDKRIRQIRKTADAIAGSADTRESPMRMAALTKSTAPAAPAGPQTVTGSAEQAQITKMQLLQNAWRNSPDPSQREAAYAELTQMLGVGSMTPPSPVTIPMRT